jgi:hypothetical protein
MTKLASRARPDPSNLLEWTLEVIAMRLIGLILALGAITWAMYQLSGGDNAETAIPVGHQQALQKAGGVEKNLMDATQKKMEDLENQQY